MRKRQAEQRHGSIGFDLKQALRQSTGFDRRRVHQPDRKTRVAMGIEREIRDDMRAVPVDANDAQALRLEEFRQRIERFRTVDNAKMCRDDQSSRRSEDDFAGAQRIAMKKGRPGVAAG